jgi:hypothetical protein
MLTGSVISGPVVRQSIMAEGQRWISLVLRDRETDQESIIPTEKCIAKDYALHKSQFCLNFILLDKLDFAGYYK